MLTSSRLNIIGVILACVTYKWYKFLQRINAKARFLTMLRSLPELSVQEIKIRVKESGRALQALVKGILDTNPQEYVISRIGEPSKLLYLALSNKKYQYGASRQVYETPVLERVSSIMSLAGYSGEKVLILDTMNTSFKAALQTVCKQQNDVQSDLFTPFLRLLSYIRDSRFLQNFTNEYSSSVYEQRFVKPSLEKVVYGTFMKDGSSVVAKGFKYIARSKKALIRLIENELRVSKVFGYLSGFLLLAAVVWFFYRATINVLAYIRRHKMDILTRLKKLIVDKYACKNCSRNIRCMILRPCTHLACCRECIDKLAGICPVCNANFRSSIELFVC